MLAVDFRGPVIVTSQSGNHQKYAFAARKPFARKYPHIRKDEPELVVGFVGIGLWDSEGRLSQPAVAHHLFYLTYIIPRPVRFGGVASLCNSGRTSPQ